MQMTVDDRDASEDRPDDRDREGGRGRGGPSDGQILMAADGLGASRQVETQWENQMGVGRHEYMYHILYRVYVPCTVQNF